MGNDPAQGANRRLELLQRPGVVLADDRVDFLAERLDRLVEADQAFSRCQPAQRLVHLGQAAFDTGKRGRVDAGLSAVVEALAKRLDFDLDRTRARAVAARR